MSRTLRVANSTIFEALDAHCRNRGVSLDSSGEKRRIWLNEKGFHIAEASERLKSLHFGLSRSLSYWQYENHFYLATVGFGASAESPILREIAVTAGIATVVLGELRPRPTAAPGQIKNIVDAHKWDDHPYDGHDAQAVLTLFPDVRAYIFEKQLDLEEIDRLFFRLSLTEVLEANSWIGTELGRELNLLVNEVPALMPVAPLSEVIFDQDPRSIFMALYRYLEGVYAFKATNDLRSSLGIEADWIQLAGRLAENLRWRPREGEALQEILRLAESDSVRDVQKALIEAGVGEPDQAAASSLYELRNRVVHYRLGAKRPEIDSARWVEICVTLCRIIREVYEHIYLNSSGKSSV